MIPHSAILGKAKDRKFEHDPVFAPNEDYHDIVDQLEKEGEWEVARVPEPYVEVKNTTLLDGDEVRFPDAVTERGRKHLELLAAMVRRGARGVILFAVNRPEGKLFTAAGDIDPEYAETLERVVDQGVEIVVARLRHHPGGTEVGGSVHHRRGLV